MATLYDDFPSWDPHTQEELLSTLMDTHATTWFQPGSMVVWRFYRSDLVKWGLITQRAKEKGIYVPRFEEAVDAVQVAEDDLPPLESVGELLQRDIPQRPFVIDQFLPVGGFSIMAGDPKTGKSTIARNVLLALARGEDAFGRRTNPVTVVYYALEELVEGVRKHFEELGAASEEIYLRIGAMPLPQVLKQLEEDIVKVNAGFAVIDPLFDALAVEDENKYGQVNRAIKSLQRVARRTRCHVMAIHHTSKAAQGNRGILGSQAFRGGTDTNIFLRRDADTDTRYIWSENRYGRPLAEHELVYDGVAVTLGQSTGEIQAENLEEEMIKALQGRRLTTTEWRNEVAGRNSRKVEMIASLVQRGVVRVEKAGKNTFHTLVED